MDKIDSNEENIFIPSKSSNDCDDVDVLLNDIESPISEDETFYQAVNLNKTQNFKEVVFVCNKYLKENLGTPRLHNILAIAYVELNEIEKAIQNFKKSVQLSPKNVDNINNLAVAYLKNSQPNEAIKQFRKALSISPDNPKFMFNLSSTLDQLDFKEEAENIYKRIIQISPDHFDANRNLVLLYNEKRDFKKAIKVCEEFIKIKPDDYDFLNLFALFCQRTGITKKAINIYLSLLEKNNDAPPIHNNLGLCYLDLGLNNLAGEHFSKALKINPNLPKSWMNLGTIELRNGRIDHAIACFNKGLSLDKNDFEIFNNLGNAYAKKRKFQKALNYFYKAIELKPDDTDIRSNYLCHLNYIDNANLKDVLDKHIQISKSYNKNGKKYFLSDGQKKKNNNKLRVGFVSPDFLNHSVSFFFLPILMNYNKNKFDFFCYYNSARKDLVTNVIQKNCDNFTYIKGLKDEQIFEKIKNDEINILVDLCGHWGNNNLSLFSKRASPIQVTWIGYPNTTGIKEIDYRFTSNFADPSKNDDQLYTEKLYRLPKTFLCYKGVDEIPYSQTPPSKFSNKITFGSFNNILKVSNTTINSWAKLLNSFPSSQLILKSSSDVDGNSFEEIRNQFENLGIFKNRIKLLERTKTQRQHLKCYNFIDIALDTFPFNGATTSFEALWMGVPVMTIEGKHHVSRVTTSILKVLNLKEFIGSDIDDLVNKTRSIIKDQKKLQFLRTNLREMMKSSILTDGVTFTKNLENAFEDMWKKYNK